MNGQNFGEHFNSLGIAEQANQETNSPVENLDTQAEAEKVPVLAALVAETPLVETVPAVAPLSEDIVQEAPMGQTIIYNKDSMGETVTPEAPNISNIDSVATLLNSEEVGQFRKRWNEIQGQFVDEPHSAVQQADALVSDVVEKITQKFAAEHSSLEDQWKQGNDVSTEDLRKALQHYRSFFNRLVV